MSIKRFMKKKKDYLKNSAIYDLVACILFSRTSVYYDNINSLFSPPYLINKLFNYSVFIVPSQGARKIFLLNIFS